MANDHYPVYNFTLVRNPGERAFRLLEKQVYFEDIAGIEGLRWHYAALGVFLLSLFMVLPIYSLGCLLVAIVRKKAP